MIFFKKIVFQYYLHLFILDLLLFPFLWDLIQQNAGGMEKMVWGTERGVLTAFKKHLGGKKKILIQKTFHILKIKFQLWHYIKFKDM